MKSTILSALMGAALLVQPTFSHPGESHEEQAADQALRMSHLNAGKRSLAHCADKLKARGNDVMMHQRRAAQVEKKRAKREIEASKPYLRARDLATVLATSHESNMTGITANTDPTTLFSGNNSCILTPEVTQGPYYVSGELFTDDMVGGQDGVPLTLSIQIIDVNTCEPVPQIYLELWHCNSTGVYSGIVANGNGNSADTSNLNNTFLRGIQQTDDSGVITMESIFPGHYTSRATHIHVLTHTLNASVLANNTLSGDTASHVGQMFFDQDLITLVEATSPYSTNTQDVTENADDSILAQEAVSVDPMVEYVLLGDDVSDGVYGWLAFGFNTSASSTITPAASYYEDGGVENSNSGGMGGGAPSGSMPSGGVPGANSTVAAGASASASASSSGSSTVSTTLTTVSSVGSTLTTVVSSAASSKQVSSSTMKTSSVASYTYASSSSSMAKGKGHSSSSMAKGKGHSSSSMAKGKGHSSVHTSATPSATPYKQGQQAQKGQQNAGSKNGPSYST